MILDVLNNEFSPKDAEIIITQIIHISIKYHEHKLKGNSEDEENVKLRENKIIELQKCLYESLDLINKNTQTINLKAQIIINLI
jgi:hypothetical protein